MSSNGLRRPKMTGTSQKTAMPGPHRLFIKPATNRRRGDNVVVEVGQ